MFSWKGIRSTTPSRKPSPCDCSFQSTHSARVLPLHSALVRSSNTPDCARGTLERWSASIFENGIYFGPVWCARDSCLDAGTSRMWVLPAAMVRRMIHHSVHVPQCIVRGHGSNLTSCARGYALEEEEEWINVLRIEEYTQSVDRYKPSECRRAVSNLVDTDCSFLHTTSYVTPRR